MIYTLAKTDKKDPGPTEAIFFTKTSYQGDGYIAYVGYEVDFGKDLKAPIDSLNDILRSVKTGNICKLVLYEDFDFTGSNVEIPGGSVVSQIPLVGLTSFKAELDLEANVKDELSQCELDKINSEESLKECSLEKKELQDKLKESEGSLKQNKEKLDACEKKSKELQDELDNKKLEDEIKKVKDKLDDCEKKGKDLAEQLEKSEQEKKEYKDQLDECEKKV